MCARIIHIIIGCIGLGYLLLLLLDECIVFIEFDYDHRGIVKHYNNLLRFALIFQKPHNCFVFSIILYIKVCTSTMT